MGVIADNLRLVEEQRQRIAARMEEICAEAGAQGLIHGNAGLSRTIYDRWQRATNIAYRDKERARARAREAAETPQEREGRLARLRAQVRKHYENPANRAKKAAYNRARYEAKHKALREQQKAYQSSEQGRATARAWYEANREKIRENQKILRRKKRRASDPVYRAQQRAAAARHRARHGDARNAKKRAYRLANLEKVKAQEAKNARRQWLRLSAAREFLRSQGIDIRNAAAAWAYVREAGLLPHDKGEPDGK
jgi:hypothetical protein